MAHCDQAQDAFDQTPGIMRLTGGHWESRIDVLGHSIGLGRFTTAEEAELARNKFLASVDMPPGWTETCSPCSPAIAAFIARNSGLGTALTASAHTHTHSVTAEDDVPGPPGQSCATSVDDLLASVPTTALGLAEVNRGKRNHGLPKGITRRPNSVKFECKVHMNGKRFYVGLFSTLEEALTAQAEKRLELVEAARQDPGGKVQAAARTTGEDEMQKLKAAIATGDNLEKVKGLRKRKNGRWETQIMHKGKRHYLGTYDTAELALEARNQRARELSITGATLPSKTPGPHRSKRGTAQPGPAHSVQMPVAAVPPSALGHAQMMSDVVYAAPAPTAAAPLVHNLAHNAPAHQQPVQIPCTAAAASRLRTSSALQEAAPAAGHVGSESTCAAARHATFSEPLRIGSQPEATHSHALPQGSASYTSAACTDALSMPVPTDKRMTMQQLNTGGVVMRQPPFNAFPASSAMVMLSGAAAEASRLAPRMHTASVAVQHAQHPMVGHAVDLSSGGSVVKEPCMGSGELLPFDVVQVSTTGAHLIHANDAHGLSAHDDVHENAYGGTDYGGFPEDGLQEKGPDSGGTML
eukprot:jgi/Ulvmu1/5597/UM023_0134.1